MTYKTDAEDGIYPGLYAAGDGISVGDRAKMKKAKERIGLDGDRRELITGQGRDKERIFILHRDVDYEFGYVVAVDVTLDHVISKIPARDDPTEYTVEEWSEGNYLRTATFNRQGELSEWKEND